MQHLASFISLTATTKDKKLFTRNMSHTNTETLNKKQVILIYYSILPYLSRDEKTRQVTFGQYLTGTNRHDTFEFHNRWHRWRSDEKPMNGKMFSASTRSGGNARGMWKIWRVKNKPEEALSDKYTYTKKGNRLLSSHARTRPGFSRGWLGAPE